jgi:hypothetical protein
VTAHELDHRLLAPFKPGSSGRSAKVCDEASSGSFRRRLIDGYVTKSKYYFFVGIAHHDHRALRVPPAPPRRFGQLG